MYIEYNIKSAVRVEPRKSVDVDFMPHVRTEEAVLRRKYFRKAKEIMYDGAFVDRFNGDVVNLLSKDEVEYRLTISFKDIPWHVLQLVVPCAANWRGTVLSDPKGNGAFQKVPK